MAKELIETATKELLELQQSINEVDTSSFLCQHDEALNAMYVQNTKLKHRLHILKKATQNVNKASQMDAINMVPIIEDLKELFQSAVDTAFPSVSDIQVVIAKSTSDKFGDYQFNSSMSISQKLKQLNEPLAPRDVATKILNCLTQSNLILKYEIAGPGYINIFINKSYVNRALKALLQNGVLPPKTSKKNVIIDFSSPNIAKEMHVGHLRSTIIGDSIARLLEFYGHNVLRLNHIGDWGTQFGMLIAYLQECFPKYLEVSPPITDLQAFYKDSKVKFDNDEEFKKKAYAAVVKLQSNDPSHIKAWTIICDVSRKEFQNIYERLDINIIERGESFYQPLMDKIVKELEAKGLLEDDNGRKIMWSSHEKKGIPLTIEKTGGGYTYDTSDMAAIKQRLHDEKGDWLIYVTDLGQATHFSTIFGCAKRAGIIESGKQRIDHVGFGVVLGEDGKKFKSRSGDTVKLVSLLDEGLKRSLEKLREKGRDTILTPKELADAQESIAYGCIKYADLSHNRTLDYTFSFDKMLEDRGNTAVYMLYALTRIKSIARTCGESYKLSDAIRDVELKFGHEKEWNLAKTLIKFPDVLNDICKDLLLHRLCEYVYEVSGAFSEFYSNCYCIEKDKEGKIVKIHDERILLAEATAIILDKCFYILGLKPLHKI